MTERTEPMWVYASLGPDETFALGHRMGQHLEGGSILALHGDLGAGKTLLVKGIAAGVAVDPDKVQSPTFVHLNIYQGETPVYHFDLYRLRDADAFLSMGFDDYLFESGICCIEWAERIESILPANALQVTMTHRGGDIRRIEIPLSQAAQLWGKKR